MASRAVSTCPVATTTIPMLTRSIVGLHNQRMRQRPRVLYVSPLPLSPLTTDTCDFSDFLDAPMVLLPVDPVHELGTPAAVSPPPAASPPCSIPSLSPAYSSTPRCWFRIDHWHVGQESMPGVEDSFDLIHETLRKNRFEVIAN